MMEDFMERVLTGLAIACIGLVVLAVPVSIGLGFTCHAGAPGSGVSVGTIVNVAEVGVLWTNPEVYLLHAGEMKAESFGIEPSLVERAHELSEAGTRVKIHYTEYLLCARWNYSNCAVIDDIKPDPTSPEVPTR